MRRSLTRNDRLRRNKDIRELFSAAARIEGRGMKLLYRSNGGRQNRFAVVVARGCGGAVRRNREKRITREAYRSLKETISSGNDLLFLVVRFGADFAERLTVMKNLVARAGLRGGQQPPVKYLAAFLITIYQQVISPGLPPACRYVPTCSEYAKEALLKHGFFKGSYLAARRLLRCHPFHEGGYDPVP